MSSKKPSFIFHPLLFGLYPVTALLASNMAQVHPEAAIRVALVSLAGSALLYWLLSRILKDAAKAGLLTSLLLLMFFSYGHVYGLVEEKTLLGLELGRHRYLLPVWAVLTAAGCAWVFKKGSGSFQLSQVLNGLSVILLALPLFQIGQFELASSQLAAKTAQAASAELTSAESSPDVYYIILDGYTRQDVLRDVYGLDTQNFTGELKDLGFAFPECAQSNYAWTAPSLSSALNMNYLETYSSLKQAGDEHIDYLAFKEYIAHNPVRQNLQNLGYRMVAFETGFPFTEVTDADLYVVGNKNPLEKMGKSGEVNAFEVMYLRTTALRAFDEVRSVYMNDLIQKAVRTPEEVHYDRLEFVLGQLETVPEIPGKKFVFAHLVAPHAPFVIDTDGKFKFSESPTPGYPNEISGLNTQVLKVVKTILSKSKTPPIIIIQGDHGWDMPNRLKILNAYYLPDGGAKNLYAQITPVNSFRVMFNTYFGGKYELLKDQSFYSTDELQLGFQPVENTCMEPRP